MCADDNKNLIGQVLKSMLKLPGLNLRLNIWYTPFAQSKLTTGLTNLQVSF